MNLQFLQSLPITGPSRHGHPGWSRLGWRPVKGSTWSVWTARHYTGYRPIEFHFSYSAHPMGMFGLQHRRMDVRVSLWCGTVNCWIKWDFEVSDQLIEKTIPTASEIARDDAEDTEGEP